jgi:hypothetical protein
MRINTVINYNSFIGSSVLIAINKSKKDGRSALYHFKRMKAYALDKKHLFDEPIKGL